MLVAMCWHAGLSLVISDFFNSCAALHTNMTKCVPKLEEIHKLLEASLLQLTTKKQAVALLMAQ